MWQDAVSVLPVGAACGLSVNLIFVSASLGLCIWTKSYNINVPFLIQKNNACQGCVGDLTALPFVMDIWALAPW